MIEQILTPNDTNVNLTFKIPKNLVGKKLKVYIDFEKENLESEMTQEEFVHWIDEAEKAPTMSLQTFNEKWEKKKKELLKLSR